MSSPSIRMRPLERLLQPGDHAQQRGLAAAGGPEQADEGAVRDGERHVLDGGEGAEALGKIVEDEAGHSAAFAATLSHREGVSPKATR